MNRLALSLALLLVCSLVHAAEVKYYDVPKGAHPHDVAADPKPGGPVWYTAQHQGALGRLDPATGKVEQIALGEGSRPHGVIIGPDRGLWITDSGLNAIVRVDPATRAVKRYPLPIAENAMGAGNDEFAGSCFSPDGSTLFVNIQSSRGMTFAIWGDWASIGL